jgi:hypothetical protein
MSRSVTEGEVTVRKTFEAEEFPVPAVKFVVESTASEPVHLRLVDPIPDSLPMENVGFHPDFEKDNWTAYKTHRVEYNRTLDPGELWRRRAGRFECHQSRPSEKQTGDFKIGRY